MIMDEQKYSPIFERTLSYQDGNERSTLRQADLEARTEPLVILGEAGMGKSSLLLQMSKLPEYAFCTARQLTSRHNPQSLLGSAKVLVIDALDEISAGKEGDAVDLVLRKLGELAYPRFVMSCRVADWRSATGTEAIKEQYSRPPTELHLEPFSDDDALAFLTASLGSDRAKAVIEHIDAKGLHALLGNPQTLGLIAEVATAGSLPSSKSELFQQAVDLLRLERKPNKFEKLPAAIDGLSATGAAFAAMILTDKEAIARSTHAIESDSNLALSEIARLPGAASIGPMLDTRLFTAIGPGSFGYLHRRIGEFLGAQWLTKQANSPRKRRRLLKLFHDLGLVPSSLRGIHAWLAKDPLFTESIIGIDPLGFIEYGDADSLVSSQAVLLLDSLRRVADENPFHYDWGFPSARSLFQESLLPAIRQEITSHSASFALRRYLIRAAKGTMAASILESEFRKLVIDPTEIYGIRSDAAEALVGSMNEEGWRSIVHILAKRNDDESARLGIEILADIGCNVADDLTILDLVIVAARPKERITGVLYPLGAAITDNRLEGMLNAIAESASRLYEPNDDHHGVGELTDLIYSLLIRRLEIADLDPVNVWRWLKPFDIDYGYNKNLRARISCWFADNPATRRAVQRLAILGEPSESSVMLRVFRLGHQFSGLQPTSADLAIILTTLDPRDHTDERWRELVAIDPLNEDIRAAAQPFLVERPELASWMNEISNPQPLQWQLEDAEKKAKKLEERETKITEARNYYLQRIDKVRSGTRELLTRPAMVYMNQYSNLNSALSPKDRVAHWLGNEIAIAALEGFEAYLVINPNQETSTEVASAISRDEAYSHWLIIAAALAERMLAGKGYSDLPDDRLIEGFYILLHTGTSTIAKISGLNESIEEELTHRGLYRSAMKCLLEPQLAAKRERISGLYPLMRSTEHAEIAAELSIFWLEKFTDLPTAVEEELLCRVIHSHQAPRLRDIVSTRAGAPDVERRNIWEAAGLLIDFDRVASHFNPSNISPELIWKLRDLGDAKTGRTVAHPILEPQQIEWIVSSFRSHWPVAELPRDGITGTQNSWDASQYLSSLIRRLGGDSSSHAVSALMHLKEAPEDSYTGMIRSIVSEQAILQVEAKYIAPSLEAIESIISDALPKTISDLQTVMLEELSVAQSKIRSDDTDSWRDFFSDAGIPYDEERCRDRLLGILRQGSSGIALTPEAHVGDDKEVDIACSTGSLRLPIEIKGQWHPQLWNAADSQLDRSYAVDWQAERRGIYLVLWFGNDVESTKRLTSPGRGKPRPKTPNDLLLALTSASEAARDGRISIVVLDLTRP